jgi:hypothetical protein
MDRPKEPKPIVISEELLAKCDLPNQAYRFDGAVRKILAIPRAEILRREEEYKRKSALNPNKRGPKRKNVARTKPA